MWRTRRTCSKSHPFLFVRPIVAEQYEKILICVVAIFKKVSSGLSLLLKCESVYPHPGLVFFQVHLCSNLGASEMSQCFMLLKLYASKNVTSDDT